MVRSTMLMRALSLPALMAALLLVAGAPPALADIPETITYQGFLTDGQGSPINGTVKLTFRLYDAATGGTQIWQETHDSVSVTNGVFIVKLGSVNPFRSLSSDDYILFNKPYFLSTEVGSDGEMSPRLELTGAPYAFSGPTFEEVTIDCTDPDPAKHESIQNVLDTAPVTPYFLVINIDGICQQRVYIRRDRVVIRGRNLNDTEPGGPQVLDPPVHGIMGIPKLSGDTVSAAIFVDGASSVIINNLKIGTLPSVTDPSRGILVYNNADVQIDNCEFSGSDYAINAFHAASVNLRTSKVMAKTWSLVLSGGAEAQVVDTTLRVDASNPSDWAPIITSRGAVLELRGTNILENGGDDGDVGTLDDNGTALALYHHSDIRQWNGHTTIRGNIFAEDNSRLDVRDADITARRLRVSELTSFRLLPSQDATHSVELSGNPDIQVSARSSITLSGVDGTAGNLSVGDQSQLSLGAGSSVTATGGLDLGHGSLLELNAAQMSIGGDVNGDSVGSLARIYGAGAKLTVTGNLFSRGRIRLCCDDDPPPELVVGNGMSLEGGQLVIWGSAGTPRAKVTLDNGLNVYQGGKLKLDTGSVVLNSGRFDVGDRSGWYMGQSSSLQAPGDAYVAGNTETSLDRATVDIGGSLGFGRFANVSMKSTSLTAGSLGLDPFVTFEFTGNATNPGSISVSGDIWMQNYVRVFSYNDSTATSFTVGGTWFLNNDAHVDLGGSNAHLTGVMEIQSAVDSVRLGTDFQLDGEVRCGADLITVSLDNPPIVNSGPGFTCPTNQ